MPDLILNGRFLMRPSTGVDRVAIELICALDQHGLPPGLTNWRALRPAGQMADAQGSPARIIETVETSGSRLTGHMWEQLTFARTSPEDWLLSLCNIGPVLRGRQIVMLHDAQVFSAPESYSLGFRSFYHALQPRLARRAAMVLTVSNHSKAELEHFGVVPKGKARVVPNGADHILRVRPDRSILHRHNLTTGAYFLAIGSLAPHKNIGLLTHAARARADTSMPLVIAGGGNASVFADTGITPSQDVRPIGRVTDAELRALYENATALVFPSLTEGFGLPPVEAMFCGCPVIASTGGAVPEVCGEAVLLVDPLDLSGWTAAMTKVAEDTDLRARLTTAGYKRAATFTWANAAAILSGHLSELPDV